MRHATLYIFLAIFLCSCNSAETFLQEADIAIEKGNYKEAIKLLDKAIEKKKYLSEAYTDKAHCYTMLDKDDSAIIVYNQLISYQPDNTLALYNSGLCKYRQEQFDEAISYFDNAMTTKGFNPHDSSKSQLIFEYTPEGNKLLGNPGKFDVALPEIFYMSGLAHYEKRQIRKAYSYFMRCISEGFNLGESHYMIAACWLSLGKKEKACESFKTSSLHGYSEASQQLSKNCN